MVKRIFTLLFFLMHSALCAVSVNLPAKVSIQIPSSNQNEEIQGEITITHLLWQQVDESSFSMEGRPLQVTKVSENYPAGAAPNDRDTLVVSKYSFTLPPKARGLYLLPEISVKVGEQIARAPQVTFEVVGAEISRELQLDARVAEKGPFYPGQTISFQYLITFHDPIQLTKEVLPLLEMKGFRTVGAPKIETLPQGDNTVQIITQRATALEPGTYHSGLSLMEGHIYGVDAYGNQVYSPTILRAEAPDVEVKVVPFPTEGMPLSFNGAMGIFYWKVQTVGSTSVATGDKITLRVTVTGSGDLDTVNFPDLSKQPGFKENFLLSDIPPVGEVKEGAKAFTVDLRPAVAGIKMVPSIQFSSFDPISGTYVVNRSEPIAITVRPGKKVQLPGNVSGQAPGVLPIEIQGNVMLTEANVSTRPIEDILLVYAFIFLVAVLGAELLFHNLAQEKKKRGIQARDLILEAIKHKSNPDECCKLIREALLLRLYEMKQTKELVTVPEELLNEGLQGEIRSLLLSIQQKRFMGLQTQVEIKEIIEEASQLFYRLK